MNTDNVTTRLLQTTSLLQDENTPLASALPTVTLCTNSQVVPASASQASAKIPAPQTSKPFASLLAERAFPEGYLEGGLEKTAEILNLFEYVRWSRNPSGGYLLISVKLAPTAKEKINLNNASNMLNLSNVEEGSHFAMTYENNRLYFTRPQTMGIDPHRKRKPTQNPSEVDATTSLEELMKRWSHRSCDDIYRFYIPQGVEHGVMKCFFTEMQQLLSESLQPEKLLIGHVMKGIIHYLKSDINWLTHVKGDQLSAQNFPFAYDIVDLFTDNIKNGF